GIRANHQGAGTRQNFFAQRASPQIAHGVVNVIGVADAGDDSLGAVFEHIGVSVELAGFAPRGNRGMFGSGDAVRGAVERILRGVIGGINVMEKLTSSERVRAKKIQEMRRDSNGSGFLGRDATETEVVQLEGKKRRI